MFDMIILSYSQVPLSSIFLEILLRNLSNTF